MINATISDQAQGIATLTLKLDATYIYHLSEGKKQQLIRLLAGKSKLSALHTLLSMPGIQGASITITGNAATLPEDPNRVHITIIYRAN